MSEAEEIVEKILLCQEEITRHRLIWEAAREAARDAKRTYESMRDDLNAYISGLKEAPLFDQSHGGPILASVRDLPAGSSGPTRPGPGDAAPGPDDA